MKKLIVVLAIVISGCVSTQMKSYVAKDIREVVLASGQPVGVVDMGDGTRAFQFMIGGGGPSQGISSQNSAQVNSDWYGKSTVTSTGGAVLSSGCLVSYITRWDESRQAWIVTDYRYPKKLVC
jgi:hypothetical protein